MNNELTEWIANDLTETADGFGDRIQIRHAIEWDETGEPVPGIIGLGLLYEYHLEKDISGDWEVIPRDMGE